MPRAKYFNPDFEKEDFRYQANWRSQRALELLNESKKTRAKPRGNYVSEAVEGRAVVRAYSFLKATDQGYGQERKQAKLMQEYFDIQEATVLERERGPKRLELRLRLLAGQSAKLIGEAMGIDHRIVFAYCIYYFDVRDLIHQQRFIHQSQGRIHGFNQNSDDLVYDGFENYCYLAANASTSELPSLVDAYKYFGDTHDLTTAIGRKRESIELVYLSKTQAIGEQALRTFLALDAQKQTKMYRDERFSTVFSSYAIDRLFTNVAPASRTVMDVDAVEPRTRRNSTEVPFNAEGPASTSN